MRWQIIKLCKVLVLVLVILSGLSIPIIHHRHRKYRRHIDPRTFYTSGRNRSQYYYVLGCEIFSLDFKPVYRFPGSLCEFFKDGSVMIAYNDVLQFFDSHMQLRWQKDLMVHHTLSSTADEKSVFLIANEFKDFNNTKTRFDVLKLIEKSSGQEIKSWSSFEHRKALLKMVHWSYEKEEHRAKWLRNVNNIPVDYEFFHFNSVYELEENAKSKQLSYLAPHHFIVNTGVGPVLFFDQNFKLINYIRISPHSFVNSHDVQITPQGDLLVYWNWKGIKNMQASMLEILEMPHLKSLWLFEKNAELPRFFSIQLGSVQLLPEQHFLFSDITEGGRVMEINAGGETIKSFFYPEIESYSNKPRQFLKVKKRDLSEFMRNHHGEFNE